MGARVSDGRDLSMSDIDTETSLMRLFGKDADDVSVLFDPRFRESLAGCVALYSRPLLLLNIGHHTKIVTRCFIGCAAHGMAHRAQKLGNCKSHQSFTTRAALFKRYTDVGGWSLTCGC